MCPDKNADFIPDEWLASKKERRLVPKWLRITLLCLLPVLIVATAIYCIPQITPIDVTMDAVKMDQAGNELGAVQLHIKGAYREYLFREPQMELEIDPFGEYMHIKANGFSMRNIPDRNFDMGKVYLVAYQTEQNSMCTLHMVFTDRFDRFIISDGGSNNAEFSYVTSVGGKYTAQEIVAYFNDFTNTGITLPEEQ